MGRTKSSQGPRSSEPGFSELDWAILGELANDPHATVRHLVRQLQLPAAEISARLRRLNRQNATRVIATLDTTAAGYNVCFVQISVRGRALDDIAAEVSAIPEVTWVTGLAGGRNDLLFIVRFINISALHDLVYRTIAGISGVLTFSITFVLDEPIYHPHYFSYGDYVPLEVEDNMRELAQIFDESKMDELDRRVVAELQQNARKSINSIARKYSINASTIRYRIRSLESRGVMRFITLLNPHAAGLHNFTLFEIEAAANQIPKIVQELGQKRWLPALFLCGGPANVVGIALAESAEAMTRIKSEELATLPGVVRVHTANLLKTYKFDARWGQRYS
jgi:DNA-binding Lrp family transcriptional regulator